MTAATLSDIRDGRSLAVQAQQMADRYALTRDLRYQRFLGVRFTAKPPCSPRRTVKLVAVPDTEQRVA